MRKIFRDLTSVEDAREKFYTYAKPQMLGEEIIPLWDALTRVLTEDIHSPVNVPPFDRASMDGFAVLASDLLGAEEGNPIMLKVVGEVAAGYVHAGIIEKGKCAEISTGAPMPSGTDSVVMVEYSKREGDTVYLTTTVTPGENVMASGADIQMGERILSGGTILSSRELAVLAAMGIKYISVIKKPRIAIISSGDEIVALGEKLLPGKLHDINSTAIATNIIENGGDPIYLGIVTDQYEETENKLKMELGKYDLILISGGTSAGMGDMLYEIIDKLGSPGLLVHGIKVKPGKPTILAVCDGNPIIGLPGFPASALSVYKLFVLPYIRKLAGLPAVIPGESVMAKVKQRFRSVMGRHEFKPVNLVQSEDGFVAYPVPGGSGAITSIALADGFVEIPEDVSFIQAESDVVVTLFSKNIQLPDLQIIGSHCMALARLQSLFKIKFPQFNSRSINVGSSGGVSAIRRKEAHIAGIHLLGSDGNYNSEGIDPDDLLIKGYRRKQGFIVKKGNPKQIFTIKDLMREDVRMMNRNPGSGTRILLDLFLKKIGIEESSINGYQNFVRSHYSSAQSVKSDYIDVAIGIENVVDDELEFIHLRDEEYDFLISKDMVESDVVKSFISVLQSDDFKNIIKGLKGYEII